MQHLPDMAPTGIVDVSIPVIRKVSVLTRTNDCLNALRISTPEARNVALLILVTGLAKLAFAATMGLGIDESYMVAAGRHLQLSYFDHPPLSWWLAWAAMRLTGSDAALAVRIPFLLLSAISTVLIYRLGRALFSRRAGMWSAVLLNLAPVIGVTTGTWVLPDGPLNCALLAFALCFSAALTKPRSWPWWIGAGGAAGLAMLSKYSAALILAGALIHIVTQPRHRVWLRRPHLYLAALLSLILFAPVLFWNARHHWVSLLFQSGRAAGTLQIHWLRPLALLGGEAIFILPWMWLALTVVMVRSVRQGPADEARWLLCCLGLPVIVLLEGISLWSSHQILYHWAAPGYLLLLPLLGAAIAERSYGQQQIVRKISFASAMLIATGVTLIDADVRWNWVGSLGITMRAGHDPTLQAMDWTDLRQILVSRNLLNARTVLAGVRWSDAGKLDYAVGRMAPVICLGDDPREFGILQSAKSYEGRDVLIVAPNIDDSTIRSMVAANFDAIDVLPPVILPHGTSSHLALNLYFGRRLHF